MRVILRPGHGMTPPAGPAIDYSPGKSGYRSWMRQRPGNREDDYTAEFCSEYLIPALVRLGHCVYPMRAMDPATGQLDTTITRVGREILPGLTEALVGNYPRWLYNASVEGALRGSRVCKQWAGDYWTHDPVGACRWETSIPDAGDQREMYLSIHQNWWPRQKIFGCNVLYWERRARVSRAGRDLARGIYGAIASSFQGDDWAEEEKYEWGRGRLEHRLATGSRWGCAGSNLGELRLTRRPAVLIELAFASNPEDQDRMHDPEWCYTMAEAVARGLSRVG